VFAWILVGVLLVCCALLGCFWFRERKKTDNNKSYTVEHSSDVRNGYSREMSFSRSDEEFPLSATHSGYHSQNLADDDQTVMLSDDETVILGSRHSLADQVDPLDRYPYLSVIDGPDAGTVFPISFATTSFGRNEGNDVVLADDSASRRHFEVAFVRPNFLLRDIGSTNGTMCNGKFIDEIAIEFGDEIQIAETRLIFSCRGVELMEQDPSGAIAVFENYIDAEPEFLLALKNLAFLLERDLRRKSEAEQLWKRIAQLEKYV